MQILQVVHGFPPYDWAGTELVTLYLSQSLRARGHEVTVFTRVADPTAPEFSLREEQWEGLSTVRVVNNYTQTTAFQLSYDNTFFDEPFTRLLARLQPDVVHFQHLAHLSVSLMPLAAALGYPVVLSVHDFFFPCHRIHLVDAHARLCSGPAQGEHCVPCLEGGAPPDVIRNRFRTVERTLQAPDVVLAPSLFLAQRMQEYFPSLQGRLRAVPLGVKPVATQPKGRKPGAPLRLLYVGMLFPPKGAHVLIEALTGIPPDAVAVSLYGIVLPFWQPYADHLREQARGLSVRFYDAFPHDQLAAVLSQHDVLVMPMICEETFSLLTREALMAGLPVVAAARGALPDIVHDGVNGLLFEPENSADLRRCLRRFIVEPDLLERLCDTPLAVKTVDKYTGEVEDIYTEICAGSYRLRSLQRGLTRQYQLSTALSQESERLRAEVAALTVQSTALRSEQDRLQGAKGRIEQERDRALAEEKQLKEALASSEHQLRECNTRLEAIYTSTTWKLYCGYAAMKHFFSHYVLAFLKGKKHEEQRTG